MRLAPLARPAFLALLLSGLACSDGLAPWPSALLSDLEGGPVFLVQSQPATVVMEALFDGRVRADDDGCLRLDLESPDGATIVWPFGATLEPRGGTYRVRDVNGRVVGVVDDRFRFGGGFVAHLHDGIPMNEDTRARADERCPGAFWIVGEIP